MAGLILGKYVDGAGLAHFIEVAVDADGRVLMAGAPAVVPLTDEQLRAAPVPVTTGQKTSVTAVIPGGNTESYPVDLGAMHLGGIILPDGWNSAEITLRVSHDGGLFPTYHRDASGLEYKIVVEADSSIAIPLADMMAIRYLIIRSGTADEPVAQFETREIILLLAS